MGRGTAGASSSSISFSGELTPTPDTELAVAPDAEPTVAPRTGSCDDLDDLEPGGYRRRYEELLRERAAEMREAASRVRREADERRQAEAEALASEERFRILVEHSSDLVLIVDAQATIAYCSPSVERLLGYRQDEVTGRPVAELVRGEALAPIVALCASGGAGGPDRGTVCATAKDGSPRWLEWTASSHLDDAAIRGFVVNVRDVTDRRGAQEALAESERRYRSLFEDSPVALWEEDHSAAKAYLEELVASGVDDIEGYLREHPAEYARCVSLARTLDVNNAAVALFEAASRQELIDRQDDVYPPEHAGGLASFWAAALVGRRTTRYEESNQTLAGHAVRVVETCIVAPGHEDTFDRVYIADVDVSERRLSEDLLQRYRLLFAEARDVMWFVRASDGRIVEANAAAEAAYGYTRDELLRLHISALRADGASPLLAEQIETAAAGGALFAAEHRRKDGSLFPVEVSARGIATLDGETLLLSVICDVTARKQTEGELARATARLEGTLEGAVAALGTTAELRDPYTAGHQRRVTELACAIATELGWDTRQIASLRTAALLHDLGKIVVPAEILSKPGKLTDTEFLLIRQHAAARAEILADIDFGDDVAAIVRQHHERLDGSGYPSGLRDGEIVPAARVLAVADVVEAMVSHRPYRAGRPLEVALAEIEEGSGRRYDPEACAACTRLVREHQFTFRRPD